MKNKKWIMLFTLLIATTVLTCAQQHCPESDFRAEPTVGGQGVRITGYVGSKFDVRIPPYIQGLPVTEIGDSAFFEEKNVTRVTIPNNVTIISYGAFAWCTGLTSINVNAGNQHFSSANGVLYNKARTEISIVPGGISGLRIPVNLNTNCGNT